MRLTMLITLCPFIQTSRLPFQVDTENIDLGHWVSLLLFLTILTFSKEPSLRQPQHLRRFTFIPQYLRYHMEKKVFPRLFLQHLDKYSFTAQMQIFGTDYISI